MTTQVLGPDEPLVAPEETPTLHPNQALVVPVDLQECWETDEQHEFTSGFLYGNQLIPAIITHLYLPQLTASKRQETKAGRRTRAKWAANYGMRLIGSIDSFESRSLFQASQMQNLDKQIHNYRYNKMFVIVGSIGKHDGFSGFRAITGYAKLYSEPGSTNEFKTSLSEAKQKEFEHKDLGIKELSSISERSGVTFRKQGGMMLVRGRQTEAIFATVRFKTNIDPEAKVYVVVNGSDWKDKKDLPDRVTSQADDEEEIKLDEAESDDEKNQDVASQASDEKDQHEETESDNDEVEPTHQVSYHPDYDTLRPYNVSPSTNPYAIRIPLDLKSKWSKQPLINKQGFLYGSTPGCITHLYLSPQEDYRETAPGRSDRRAWAKRKDNMLLIGSIRSFESEAQFDKYDYWQINDQIYSYRENSYFVAVGYIADKGTFKSIRVNADYALQFSKVGSTDAFKKLMTKRDREEFAKKNKSGLLALGIEQVYEFVLNMDYDSKTERYLYDRTDVIIQMPTTTSMQNVTVVDQTQTREEKEVPVDAEDEEKEAPVEALFSSPPPQVNSKPPEEVKNDVPVVNVAEDRQTIKFDETFTEWSNGYLYAPVGEAVSTVYMPAIDSLAGRREWEEKNPSLRLVGTLWDLVDIPRVAKRIKLPLDDAAKVPMLMHRNGQHSACKLSNQFIEAFKDNPYQNPSISDLAEIRDSGVVARDDGNYEYNGTQIFVDVTIEASGVEATIVGTRPITEPKELKLNIPSDLEVQLKKLVGYMKDKDPVVYLYGTDRNTITRLFIGRSEIAQAFWSSKIDDLQLVGWATTGTKDKPFEEVLASKLMLPIKTDELFNQGLWFCCVDADASSVQFYKLADQFFVEFSKEQKEEEPTVSGTLKDFSDNPNMSDYINKFKEADYIWYPLVPGSNNELTPGFAAAPIFQIAEKITTTNPLAEIKDTRFVPPPPIQEELDESTKNEEDVKTIEEEESKSTEPIREEAEIKVRPRRPSRSVSVSRLRDDPQQRKDFINSITGKGLPLPKSKPVERYQPSLLLIPRLKLSVQRNLVKGKDTPEAKLFKDFDNADLAIYKFFGHIDEIAACVQRCQFSTPFMHWTFFNSEFLQRVGIVLQGMSMPKPDKQDVQRVVNDHFKTCIDEMIHQVSNGQNVILMGWIGRLEALAKDHMTVHRIIDLRRCKAGRIDVALNNEFLFDNGGLLSRHPSDLFILHARDTLFEDLRGRASGGATDTLMLGPTLTGVKSRYTLDSMIVSNVFVSKNKQDYMIHGVQNKVYKLKSIPDDRIVTVSRWIKA